MSGRPPPPKPWERARAAGGAATGGTPADSLPKPWERPAGAPTETVTPVSTATPLLGASTAPGAASTSTAVTPAARPWERAGGAVGTSYGTGTYGSSYSSPYSGGYGGGYGSMYSSPGGMYSRPYGSYGGYGGSMYGGGMYGSNMYGGGYGGMGYGGGMYGGGMMGRPMGMPGPFDPNDPNGPPAPPSAWQAMLHSIQGVMHFFGRLSFLVDENAHAVHFFVTALLQLLDRFGSLYGEIARFILRLLGFRTGKRAAAAGKDAAGTAQAPGAPVPMPAAAPGADSQWNSLWSNSS